ncbi:MAG: MBL fold metallo-hydrolase [Halobacteriota archaeon]
MSTKLRVVFDNQSLKPGLKEGWGFSCLIEHEGSKVLFDTGADGSILRHNMGEMGIDIHDIDMVIISHGHGDHTGGLREILKVKPEISVAIPQSITRTMSRFSSNLTPVSKAEQLLPGIWSTGELPPGEQGAVIETGKGNVLVTGCSHPGLGKMIEESERLLGELFCIIGGFHGFTKVEMLGDRLVYPCHCTMLKSKILERENSFECGAGLEVDF